MNPAGAEAARVYLAEAASEMGRLGVKASPVWTVRLGSAGGFTVSPGVTIGRDTYTTEKTVLLDPEQALEWAVVVASLARGAQA